MTGPDPFVPPGQAPQPASVPLPPPDAATYRGPAVPVGLPSPPPPPKRPGWVLPVAITGGAVLLAGIVVAGAIALSSVGPRFLDTVAGGGTVEDPAWEDVPPSDDLLQGDPGSPLADAPLDCVGCFTDEDVRGIRPSETEWDYLGLTEGDTGPFWRQLGDEQSLTADLWETDEVTPDECYFTWAIAPLPLAPEALDTTDPRADQTIVMSPDRTDPGDYYAGRTGARVFADSTEAVAHMTELEAAIAACPDYFSAETGTGATVTAGPGLYLPDSVAGYTWVEDSGGAWRYYGAELQRGNVVVRITMNSDGWGPSEQNFRTFVEAYAVILSIAKPTG